MADRTGGKWLALSAALAVLISLTLTSPKAPVKTRETVSGPEATVRSDTLRVVRIIDGDTFVLSDGRRIRLLGLDTPEEGEPFYELARTFADSVLGRKPICLETGKSAEDRYGRTLAYLYVDGVLYNEKIIRAGLARVYLFDGNERHTRRLILAQTDARREKRGIWSLPEPEEEEYYVAPAGSFRFHRPLCPAVKNTNLKKARRFSDRGSALDQGFSPCRNCRP